MLIYRIIKEKRIIGYYGHFVVGAMVFCGIIGLNGLKVNYGPLEA